MYLRRATAGTYGDVKFIFDTDKIPKRTSFTFGDSLGAFESKETTASPLLHPSIASAASDRELMKFLQDLKLTEYIELQIQNGAELSEIKADIIPKHYVTNDVLGDLLRTKGIIVIYE